MLVTVTGLVSSRALNAAGVILRKEGGNIPYAIHVILSMVHFMSHSSCKQGDSAFLVLCPLHFCLCSAHATTHHPEPSPTLWRQANTSAH